MTSPVPIRGSGAVSTESGVPKALRMAAFMSVFTSRSCLTHVPTALSSRKTWYYPRTDQAHPRPARFTCSFSERIAMADPRRVAFGDFLRSRRERLTPKSVGLASGRRRRTAGLRREEVAELAGIGVDWYIRLEQGRTVNPSVTTVDALARALRLSKAEHAHLRALARDADRRAFAIETVPDQIRRMIDGLNQPAYLTGRRWDVLAWNAAAEEIFGFGRLAEGDRNVLLLMLTNPKTRAAFGDGWAEE